MGLSGERDWNIGGCSRVECGGGAIKWREIGNDGGMYRRTLGGVQVGNLAGQEVLVGWVRLCDVGGER